MQSFSGFVPNTFGNATQDWREKNDKISCNEMFSFKFTFVCACREMLFCKKSSESPTHNRLRLRSICGAFFSGGEAPNARSSIWGRGSFCKSSLAHGSHTISLLHDANCVTKQPASDRSTDAECGTGELCSQQREKWKYQKDKNHTKRLLTTEGSKRLNNTASFTRNEPIYKNVNSKQP